MKNRLRLALLGAGKITGFHVPAARRAGFEVTAVAARPGSGSPRVLADQFDIPRVHDGVDALLADRGGWDALLVAVPVPALLDVLQRSMASGAPVLVEKPAALRSADLAPLLDDRCPVMVAYNRRFYPGVQAARAELRARPPALGSLTLPERIAGWGGAESDPEALLPHFANSVHAFDLVQFLFGRLDVVHTERVVGVDGQVPSLVSTLRSARGDVVQVLANWGTPTNMTVTIDWPGRRLELRPLEHLTVYDALEVVEPSQAVPIRSYRPRVADQVPLRGDDVDYKPGFVAQLREFMAMCRGEPVTSGATLRDAAEALRLAEELVATTW